MSEPGETHGEASRSQTVAVVGMGRMGQAFARRLAAADDVELVVANRTRARAEELVERHGGTAVPTGSVLARAALCIVSVPDGPALEQVVGELLPGAATRDRTIIDMSTVDVESSARAAEAARQAGVAFLRAPVSGNPSVVDGGNLAIMISGPEPAFEAARSTLAIIGPHLFYLGEDEQARVMKLALNLMIAGTTELLAEAVLLAERNGLAREDALHVICNTVIASPFVKYKAPALAAHDYTPTATAALVAKDMELAVALARSSGVPAPVTELVQELLAETLELGHGDQDFMALALRLEAAGGLASARHGSP